MGQQPPVCFFNDANTVRAVAVIQLFVYFIYLRGREAWWCHTVLIEVLFINVVY